MKHISQSHRNTVNSFFQTHAPTPIKLSDAEFNHFNTLLARLITDIGNLHWLSNILLHSLDVYWKNVKTSDENALAHEAMISFYMQQVAIGKQFSRIHPNAIARPIEYDAVTIKGFYDFWHPYYDPDLPKNFESFEEPYRTLFSTVKYVSAQMLATANNEEAMRYIASLLGAFSLAYPIEYLHTDTYFQKYLDQEVQEIPLDDDYTFYLCRMIDYSLFDRSS